MVQAVISESNGKEVSPTIATKNDIFISYSRKDKEFIQTLVASFRERDHDPWVDWQDIQPTEDWWKAIQVGIEAADTFIFVLSPDSISSTVCRQEIEHAVQCNKRMVPIVWREGFSMQDVHPELGKHNWLFFRTTDDYDKAFETLVEAVDADLGYVRLHTRLLLRAIE